MAELTFAKTIRRTIAMTPETAYGVDEFGGTVLAADIIPDARNILVTPQIEEAVALPQAVGFLGTLPSVVAMFAAQVTFEVPIRGRGVAYAAGTRPFADLPLRGCGMQAVVDATPGSEMVTYTPRSTGFEAMTIYVMQDNGVTYEIVGAFGDATITWAARQPIVAAFRFLGKLDAVSALALVEGTPAPTPAFPQFKSAAFQIGTENFAARLQGITLNLANQISPVVDQNEARALAGYFIGQRTPNGTFDPEMVPIASYDWLGKLDLNTLQDITWQSGPDTQYNRLKVTIPQAQLTSASEGDRGGARIWNFGWGTRVSTGNDEYTLVFD